MPPVFGKNGLTEKVSFNIQRGHAKAAEIIAARGKFPWQHRSEVFRYCVKFGLDHIDSLDPGHVDSVMRRANMMIEAARQQDENAKFLEVFDKLREQIAAVRSHWERAQVASLIGYYDRQIKAMPDEPEHEHLWKMRYEQELERYKEQVAGWGD